MGEIEFWHWLVAGLLLGGLDMLAMSGFFLWLGGSAFAVGAVVFFVPELTWQGQFLIFGVGAILAVVVTRLILRTEAGATDKPNLNRRSRQYLGQLIVLESPIVNGRGRAFVADTLWTVEGPDLPVGQTVRVVGTDGMLLQVEKTT